MEKVENAIARLVTSGRKLFGGSSPIVMNSMRRFKSVASPPTASSFTRTFGSARFSSPPRSSLSSSLPPRQEEDTIIPARHSLSSEYSSAAYQRTQQLREKQEKEAEDQRLKEEKEKKKKEEELAALKKGKFQCGELSCKEKRFLKRKNRFTVEDLKNHFKDSTLHEDNPTVLYACKKCHDTFGNLKDFEKHSKKKNHNPIPYEIACSDDDEGSRKRSR